MSKCILTLAVTVIAFSAAPSFAESSETVDHKPKAERFKKIDTDNSGDISKEEFLTFQAQKFSKIDTDGNGAISKEEMKAKRHAFKEKLKERRQERKADNG